MILISSCKSREKTKIIDTGRALISISKGRCLGDCSVYDLWVFKNGHVIYNGIDNVNKKGIQETSVSRSKIDTLIKLMVNIKVTDLGEIKGKDKPLTILKFKDKKFVFQPQKTKGNLQKINSIMENIHLSINN